MGKRKVIETSQSAYKSLDPDSIRAMYKKIASALQALGSSTFEEVAAYLDEKPERIWKRLDEARKIGLCHRPGEKKKMSSGRCGFLWKAGDGPDVIDQKSKLSETKTIADHSRAIKKLAQPINQTTLF
jgi:hypothetical protein